MAKGRGGHPERPRGTRARFERIASAITRLTGNPATFAAALGIVLVWAATGPLFHYSDTWQLVINTGTTIVTFLMVFLIQQTQNKDSLAIQLKLNELVAALEGASNRLVNVEDLTEHELRVLRRYYERLARLAKDTADLTESHSIDEAERRHHGKLQQRKTARGA